MRVGLCSSKGTVGNVVSEYSVTVYPEGEALLHLERGESFWG